jgi:antitoxin component YwqK of YwqJK toxin-antitoxin module
MAIRTVLQKHIIITVSYRMQGRYALGVKAGEWKYYYENGTINYTENYVDGEEQGEQLLYREDGSRDRDTYLQ